MKIFTDNVEQFNATATANVNFKVYLQNLTEDAITVKIPFVSDHTQTYQVHVVNDNYFTEVTV